MDYKHYKQVDAYADELYLLGNYEEALGLLQTTLQQFPEYLFNNLLYQTILFRKTGEYEKGYRTVEKLIKQGYFLSMEGELWDPLKQINGFTFLSEENERLKAKAKELARMEYSVFLPNRYTEGERFPLFLILHGDGGNANLEQFSWYWPPEAVTQLGFIAVYVQSSQVLDSRNFAWTLNPSVARLDVKKCYEIIKSQYSIDQNKIIVGGFSGGAITAIDIVLSDTLPICGFICVSPELKPNGFSSLNVRNAAQRGVKGVFMEGDLVIPVTQEEEMMQTFRDAGLSYQFYTYPGLGHEIPKELAGGLSRALEYIFK